jgi:hypothetical protein
VLDELVQLGGGTRAGARVQPPDLRYSLADDLGLPLADRRLRPRSEAGPLVVVAAPAGVAAVAPACGRFLGDGVRAVGRAAAALAALAAPPGLGAAVVDAAVRETSVEGEAGVRDSGADRRSGDPLDLSKLLGGEREGLRPLAQRLPRPLPVVLGEQARIRVALVHVDGNLARIDVQCPGVGGTAAAGHLL